jgi:hypothetical protein
MGLSFTIAAGPRRRGHSQVRVLWDSRPYFTLTDSRFPFSSPPPTRTVTAAGVEVFDSASTGDLLSNGSLPSQHWLVSSLWLTSARFTVGGSQTGLFLDTIGFRRWTKSENPIFLYVYFCIICGVNILCFLNAVFL